MDSSDGRQHGAWMTHAGPMPAAIRAYCGGRVICDLPAYLSTARHSSIHSTVPRRRPCRYLSAGGAKRTLAASRPGKVPGSQGSPVAGCSGALPGRTGNGRFLPDADGPDGLTAVQGVLMSVRGRHGRPGQPDGPAQATPLMGNAAFPSLPIGGKRSRLVPCTCALAIHVQHRPHRLMNQPTSR